MPSSISTSPPQTSGPERLRVQSPVDKYKPRLVAWVAKNSVRPAHTGDWRGEIIWSWALPRHFGQHHDNSFMRRGCVLVTETTPDTRLAVSNISLKKRRGHLKSDIKQIWAKLFLHCPGYNNILCFHRRLQFSVLYFLEKIKLKPSVTQDVVWHTDSHTVTVVL